MKAVYKYPLITEPEILAGRVTLDIDLPLYSKVLTIDKQYDVITLWALVDPDAQTEPHTIIFLPTGLEVPNDIEMTDFIMTYMIDEGEIEYHIFFK